MSSRRTKTMVEASKTMVPRTKKVVLDMKKMVSNPTTKEGLRKLSEKPPVSRHILDPTMRTRIPTVLSRTSPCVFIVERNMLLRDIAAYSDYPF
jgi:hypothetical protein